MLINVKNRVTLVLSALVLLVSFIIHILHRVFNISEVWGHQHVEQVDWITNIFLGVPIVLFLISLFLYRKQKDHSLLPLFNTLTITFSSISMIAGGGGMVEYHFSIFMVVAMIGYYERIHLIVVMTLIFAVQHLVGYFFMSEYVFGSNTYPFSMMMMHAIFLIGTSGAIIWQTNNKQKLLASFDETEEKQKILSGIIEQLSSTSDKLVASSSQLTQTYQSNQQTMGDIVSQIQEISQEAATQKEQTVNSADVIQEIETGIQGIDNTSSDVSQSSIATTKAAHNGNEMIQEAVQQMNSISSTVSETSEMIQLLHHQSQEIGKIVGLITEIASQTDLLALNAAIEASRAGEYGRGFAVVAAEVRKLADQSASFTKEITQLIQSVQQDSVTSVNSMKKVIDEVDQGRELVEESGQIFGKINQSIEGVTEQVKHISASAGDLSATTEQAAASIQEMASFAELAKENAANAADSSAVQLSSTEFLSSLIATLSEVALELEGLIQKTEALK